jgi:hypothetical protein
VVYNRLRTRVAFFDSHVDSDTLRSGLLDTPTCHTPTNAAFVNRNESARLLAPRPGHTPNLAVRVAWLKAPAQLINTTIERSRTYACSLIDLDVLLYRIAPYIYI